MSETIDPATRYLEALEAAAPAAAKGLRQHLPLSRGGAAEAFAAAGALLPSALARHQARRGGAPGAARDVLRKFGLPAGLKHPSPALRAQISRSDLSPRLGGLLGDDGPRAAAWIAARTGDDASALGCALAACAPLVLGALGLAAEDPALAAWLGGLSQDVLGTPAGLAEPTTMPGAWFAALRARAFPWWTRVLP